MLHNGGPSVLRGGDVHDVRLPAELRAALDEWSEVAEVVLRSGDVHNVDLLRRRGRQLASRAADALGRPVDFVDPVSGAVESIRAGSARNGAVAAAGPVLSGTAVRTASDGTGGAASNRAGTAGPVSGSGMADGAVSGRTGSDGAVSGRTGSDGAVSGRTGSDGAVSGRTGSGGVAPAPVVAARPALAIEPPGPTPWGTGCAVATFFAVLVAIADVVLARAFAGAFGLLWVPANLLVTAGTLPSLWLAREVPFWRWPAFGAAAGLGTAWLVMLVGLLGP